MIDEATDKERAELLAFAYMTSVQKAEQECFVLILDAPGGDMGKMIDSTMIRNQRICDHEKP